MAVGTVRVVVYDSRIDLMEMPTGAIYNYARKKVTRTVFWSKQVCPVRTGRLRGSIHSDGVRRLARGHVIGRVKADASYSAAVHGGTAMIRPKNGLPMLVPVAKYSPMKRWYVDQNGNALPVRGQKANPFLLNGLAYAFREHLDSL